jgi:hypothetical protein
MVIMVCQQPGDRHGLTDNTIPDRLSTRTTAPHLPAGTPTITDSTREAGGRLWPEARLGQQPRVFRLGALAAREDRHHADVQVFRAPKTALKSIR